VAWRGVAPTRPEPYVRVSPPTAPN
jgi:hypothetical protein